MSLGNIFHWSYWFTQPPELGQELRIIGVLIAVGSVILAIIIRFLVVFKYKKDLLSKKIGERMSNSIFFFGLTSLVWFVFRTQSIPFLSYRFWFLVIVAITARWMYVIIKYAVKRVPEIRKEQLKKEQKEKYFPKNYSMNH